MSSTMAEAVDNGMRVAPPITVSAASFMGMGLEDWMYIATIIYTTLQVILLVYQWKRGHYKHRRNDDVPKNNRKRSRVFK